MKLVVPASAWLIPPAVIFAGLSITRATQASYCEVAEPLVRDFDVIRVTLKGHPEVDLQETVKRAVIFLREKG
jgi:hypothetical protein